MTGSSRRTMRLAAIVTLTAMSGAAVVLPAAEPALKLNAAVVGATPESLLAIELFRWSTDTERAPVHAALAPAPAPAPAAAPAASGRGGRGRGGRGAAPPPSPAARLTAAIKAAPTVGFVWGDGPTGHSIKYAWHTVLPDGLERIVLATDRRLGAHATSWPPAARANADPEFTVIEIRIGGRGAGEGKASLTTTIAVDPAATALALEGYEAAPVLFKVTR